MKNFATIGLAVYFVEHLMGFLVIPYLIPVLFPSVFIQARCIDAKVIGSSVL
jgi:ethanolamine transporter EutH